MEEADQQHLTSDTPRNMTTIIGQTAPFSGTVQGLKKREKPLVSWTKTHHQENPIALTFKASIEIIFLISSLSKVKIFSFNYNEEI